MLELGAEGATWHERAGRQAASNDFDLLVTVGELARRVADGAIEAGMRQERVHCYADRDAAAGAVSTLIQPGDTILVKGSRRVGLERVVQEIESLTAARL
jgi:UDP-N-acetylmuramoyl-tripeptide--D-alanyl-D-alanine ligase